MNNIKGTKESMDMPAKPKRILPSFTLTSEDLPEIKDWKVGGSYYLKIKVEQVNLGKGEYDWQTIEKGEKKMHARFQMHAVEAIKENKSYSEEYAEKRSKAPRA